MTDVLEINGKTLHTIKAAAQEFSYSRDYITRLAREKKISATTVGRQWFVDLDSLREYVSATAREQEERNRRLSEERRSEQATRKVLEEYRTRQSIRARRLPVSSVVVATVVLVSGLMSGVIFQHMLGIRLPTLSLGNNVILTAESLPITGQSAAVTTPGDIQRADMATEEKSDSDPVLAEVASKAVKPIGDDSVQGVLLLPDPASSTTELTDLFSDPVVLKERADGTTVVVPVDERGQPVGIEVPYVLVPVKQEKI